MNRRDDTLECLDSLRRNSYSNHKLIVLDNHSTDGSVAAIRTAHPEVQIVELEQNLGYAGNNNRGITLAMQLGADWIFLLNDDVILDGECLAKLVEVGESDCQIGILGPLVYHHDEPDIIQSAGGMLGKYWTSLHLGQNEKDQGQFPSVHEVEWISGCALFVHRKVIEQVGMLDPNYFLYWEETEWCLRASRAGWKIVHVPQAKLWHKGVQRNYKPKPYVTYYLTRNQLFTLAKHKAPFIVWVYTLAHIIRTLVSWTIRPRWRFKREHRNAMLLGMAHFLRNQSGQMPPRQN